MNGRQITERWQHGVLVLGSRGKSHLWTESKPVCMCVGHVHACSCAGQRTTCGSRFSSFSTWLLGIELRSSGLVGKYLYLLSHLEGLGLFTFNTYVVPPENKSRCLDGSPSKNWIRQRKSHQQLSPWNEAFPEQHKMWTSQYRLQSNYLAFHLGTSPQILPKKHKDNNLTSSELRRSASRNSPVLGSAGAGLISRRLHYHANPCPTSASALIWICVCSWKAALMSKATHVKSTGFAPKNNFRCTYIPKV